MRGLWLLGIVFIVGLMIAGCQDPTTTPTHEPLTVTAFASASVGLPPFDVELGTKAPIFTRPDSPTTSTSPTSVWT